ncbi:MAG: UDP-N-acetylglucosamine 2-epimerase (non-hydrolyzing) [Candidatus Bathyarchaeia archaeon]
MSRIEVVLVVGARPQFIKSAPVIKEILSKHKQIHLNLIHSGQHYDPEMSEIFFRQLQIPPPSVNLQAGSGSHAVQTAIIMKRLEGPILEAKPDLVLVPGDTNTTLAASLTAAKLCVPVAHIEAGLRSDDMTMPEEINRRLTDHCSTLLFAPTHVAMSNLRKEGLDRIAHLTGDTMVDALQTVMPIVRAREAFVLERLGLQPRRYVLVTLHRPANVDDLERLHGIKLALHAVASKLPVVFPVHPRTRARLAKAGHPATLRRNGLTLTGPRGYIETLSLLKNAGCLLTDSGGMQKEAFLLHIPCVTLRSTTEWPETLTGKANRLLTQPEMIAEEILELAFDARLRGSIGRLKNPFGDGHASARIAKIIERTLGR